MTDTQTATATVYTVVVRTSGDGSFTWNRALFDTYGTTTDGRTFFAIDSVVGDGWVTLFAPESDPRHVGMWEDSGDLRNLSDDWRGESPLHGWHVRRDALAALEALPATPADSTPVETPGEPEPEFLDTTFGAIPVGTEWSNRGQWDSGSHWVKIDPERYVSVSVERPDLSGYINTSRPDYAVTIRNSAHVPTVDNSDNSEEVTRLRDQLRNERLEFERWKENAQEVATDYANSNGLCSEFDRCMEAIGLEGRQREYDVTVRETRTYSFSLTVPRGTDVEEYVRDAGGPEEFDMYPDVDYDVDYTEA